MKTFVSDDYQMKLDDKGGFTIQLWEPVTTVVTEIAYNPGSKKHWIRKQSIYNLETDSWKTEVIKSQSLSDLRLLKRGYERLRKALESVGKQALVDNEIIFVDKKKK